MADADRRIVSSRHLAEGDGWEMSELEYGMIIAYNGFTRWMQRCMGAAGLRELTPLEILILHNTNSRDTEKKLSDICFLLNIEDSHTVNYALRKLLKLELIQSEKRGKEVFYKTSDEGRSLCMKYRELRKQFLLDSLYKMGFEGQELRDVARILRGLSGQYDQASRAVSSL